MCPSLRRELVPMRLTSQIRWAVLCLLLLAVASLATPVSAQQGAVEVTVSKLKENLAAYDSKLISVAGIVRDSRPGVNNYTLVDPASPSDTVRVWAKVSPTNGTTGKMIGTVQSFLFDESIVQAVWMDDGERWPDLFNNLVTAVGLQAKAESLVTYCDQLVLASCLGDAYVVRVVVVGPGKILPDEPADVAVGLFPYKWQEFFPAGQTFLGQSRPATELAQIKVSLIYPDDTVQISDAPITIKYYTQTGQQHGEWITVEQPSWLVNRILDIAIDAVIGRVLGPYWAIAKICSAVAEGEPGSPLRDLTLQEFENLYDVLNLPTDNTSDAQAVAFRVFMKSSEAKWPLPWVTIDGQLTFRREPGNTQKQASFEAVVPVQDPLAEPYQVVEVFMEALKGKHWEQAFRYIYRGSDADEVALREKWTKTLRAAFERANLINWRVLDSRQPTPTTFIAEVEFTVRDSKTDQQAKNEMTLKLILDDGRWAIKSIASK